MGKWSRTFRIWHWLFALTFVFMSTTVLVRKTVMGKDQASIIITQNLQNLNIDISKDDAVLLARKLRTPLWQWHIWGGYLFAILVAVRLVLISTHSGKRNYQNCDEKSLHKKMVSGVYISIYTFAFILTITGLGIKFDEEIGISKEFKSFLKETHEFTFYLMLPLVAAHIGGVIIAEHRNEQGIISDMINGGKSEK